MTKISIRFNENGYPDVCIESAADSYKELLEDTIRIVKELYELTHDLNEDFDLDDDEEEFEEIDT